MQEKKKKKYTNPINSFGYNTTPCGSIQRGK